MPKGVGLKPEQMYLITLKPFTIERGVIAIGALIGKGESLTTQPVH